MASIRLTGHRRLRPASRSKAKRSARSALLALAAVSPSLSALMATIAMVGTAFAADVQSTWNTGVDGNWGSSASWSPTGVPNNAGSNFYHVFIDSSGASVTVTVDGIYTVDRLRVDAGDRVAIANTRRLLLDATRGAGVLENLGTVELGSTGTATYFQPRGGPVTLQGGGTLLLSNAANNFIYRGDVAGSLVNVDNSIRGAGHLGWISSPTPIANSGLIIADQTTPLTVNGSGGLTNTGTMRAEAGATMLLDAGTYDNAGGVIEALAGSWVDLDGSSAISGGTLQTSGDGAIRSISSGTPSLENVTNLGLVEITNDNRLALRGTIQNEGTIWVNGSVNNTYLRASGEVSLSGGGTIQLSNSATNWIFRHDSPGALVNVDNTIRGAGNLGWISAPTPISNQSLIIADQATPLVVNGSGGVINSGTMRAEAGATMLLDNGNYDNTGGVIEALAGSRVDLGGSSAISGGILQTSGDGAIRSISGGAVSFENVTNLALVEITNDKRLTLRGTIQNEGTIWVNSSGSATYLRPAGEVILSGGGTIQLSDNAVNWIYRADSEGALRNAGNTIRGSGNLGWSASPTPLTNDGLIIADQTTPLVVNGSGGVTNNGTMRAEAGATMLLNAGTYDNTEGVIEALAGSRVDLDGSSAISGGTLQTADDGAIRAISGTGAILEDLTNLGLIEVLDGKRLHLREGTIQNHGTIRLSSSGDDTYLRPAGGVVTLSGGGVIELSNSASNWIYRADSNGALVNLDNTIRGAGNIGWISSPTPITNAGFIIADQTTPLSVDAGTQMFTNSGTVRTLPSSTLQCKQTPTNFSNGTLTGGNWEAIDGTLRLQGVNVVTNEAGILLDGPSSVIYNGTTGTTSAVAGLATNGTAGRFAIQNGRDFTTAAAFHNAGDVIVGNGCTFTSTGPYTQSDGITLVDGILDAPSPIEIQGGILGGNGTVNADVTNARRVSPGASVGTLTINGDYEQLSEYGRLVIEIGGTLPEEFDRLDVVGQAVLAGYLEVVAVDDFVVEAGDSFQILTCSSRQGEFVPTVACLAPGICFNIVYGDNDVTLVAYELDPADVPDEEPLPQETLPTATRFYTTSSVGVDCQLHLDLPSTANVDLRVFDLTGRQVARLWNGSETAGAHMYRWSGIDDAGRRCSSGIYFARAIVRSEGDVFRQTLRLPTIR